MTYTDDTVRYLLRHLGQIEETGRLPVSSRAPGRTAGRRQKHGPQSPTQAAEILADLHTAFERLSRWELLCLRCYRQNPARFEDPPPRGFKGRQATRKQRDGLSEAVTRIVAVLNGREVA